MTTTLRKLTVAVGAVLVAAMMSATAYAGCGDLGNGKAGLKKQAWHGAIGSPALRLISAEDNDPITGMWKVTFTAGGTVIDAGFAVWHADGTEITNSGGRSPLTGNFCMGVWKKSGSHYKLNHLAIGWDSTGTTEIGVGSIVENVTLGADGNYFSGTFVITQYDMNGNVLATVSGDITGSRINADSVVTTF